MNGTGPAIRAEGLSKRFGERTAFEGLTFTVERGEVFGFLGPNGAGKTTTVRVLSTLISASDGRAEVAGVPVGMDSGPELRRHISVMPETPGLYTKLSVVENLEFFAGLYEVPPAETAGRIDEALRAVGLSERRADLAGSLSKGLRQRVALARALLPRPEVLFLDEPTSGLDPEASLEVRELLEQLGTSGVTIFLTTHRLDEAARLCDRVAILNTTLRSVGTPAELTRGLFANSLDVRVAAPLPDPGAMFHPVPGVNGWRDGAAAGAYVLDVDDPSAAAPAVARALVAAGADVVRLAEVEYTLEDVYLELVGEERVR
jgi:ABC-2 type transport system ATP-binding protein